MSAPPRTPIVPAASVSAPPTISLPKGGGAVRGIGDKFAGNPATGSGSLTIPLAVSAGRSGFGPQLTLSYDSSAGNGPFGFGWSLGLPAIVRKTDKGVPRYLDADESDVFVMSGAEDLVPVLAADGTRFADTTSAPGFVIHRYRPRVESAFARIDRWTRVDTGDVHWRSISPSNVTTLYGATPESRIVDVHASSNGTGIFSWLICQSHDDKGNAIVYDYVPEDGANVDLSQAHERNRARTAARYLKRIRYGNIVSRLIQPDLSQASWLFEVVFDYDEAHYDQVPLDPAQPPDEQHRFVRAAALPGQPWTVRPDPFSMHRSGFEVRTYRRCRRVLMFHHIPDLPTGEPGYDGLVRATEFDYADLDYSQPVAVDDELAHQGSTRFASFIRRVTQSGYVRDDTKPPVLENGVSYASYLARSFPPVEFTYSKAIVQDRVLELDAVSLENLPAGVDAESHYWVDLDGEGVSGILIEQTGGWFYKSNLGDGHFGPAEDIVSKPALTALGGGVQQFVDLAGDGQLDLAVFHGAGAGFYERTLDARWKPFRAFNALPNAVWDDPNLRFVDLDGDGRTDVLIADNAVFTGHLSLAESGFGPALRVHQPADEERGPRLVFADAEQTIYLADMCGDGLTDLVRIRNGEVCYWPNLGYGRFGAKVSMDNAPRMDRPDQFDHRRVRLADIDGSGTHDIIYLGRDAIRLYFNQSGNRWSDARPLAALPHLDNVAAIRAADLLGNGTACLVWSSPLPSDRARPVRYIDLMGSTKPHLLIGSINNLGAETRVEYAPSTRFYLADKREGRPWVTRLPFPVHVVERIETYDRVSGNRFVTRQAYHHGHYDGVEREFRGFGLVEQWDTETFAALTSGGTFPPGANEDESSHVPPTYTKTWFHTGVYLGRERVSRHLASEYYREPGLSDAEAGARLLDDTVMPDGLSVEEEREACRALRGFMLRQEIYALDGTDREPHPYTVTEQNFTVRRLQALGANRYAVFLTHGRETLTYRYEREPSDPRVSHGITPDVDAFGNVLTSVAIAYGRRTADPALAARDQAKQSQLLITYSEHDYTNVVDTADAYRTPLLAETRAFELTGATLAPGALRFSFDDIRAAGAAAAMIPYEQAPQPNAIEKRVIARMQTIFRRDDLTGPLPLGSLESLALPFDSFTLALTAGLVTAVYGGRVDDAMLTDEGRYVHVPVDTDWWMPSGRIFYSPGVNDSAAQELAFARGHFFQAHRFRDPFHTNAVSTEHVVSFDAYDLLVQETRDPFGNLVTIGERNVDPTLPLVRSSQDYRLLVPALVMDPNRNRTAISYDALGMVAGLALMGKPEESPVPGDQLTAAFRADLTPAEVAQFFADPKGASAPLLVGDATSRTVYDLDAYQRDPLQRTPAMTAILARETHASDPTPPDGLRIQVSFTYSDGFAREIQKKGQAEPGPTPQRDATGAVVVGANGQPEMTTTDSSPRWVGSGWTVFNNKGQPVRQYEAFFTDTHRFEFDMRIGVSPVLCYDPLGRVVATLRPDHTWEKVAFDNWREERWDVNDTVLLDPVQDEVIGPFVAKLPDDDYLPTWHSQRAGGALGSAEQHAAEKAAVHAATPTRLHGDVRGRTFLTVAHNRFEDNGSPVEEFYETRLALDIRGQTMEVEDALGRLVMRYDYDVAGREIHHASMDSGERWTLHDATSGGMRAWDDRAQAFRTHYDQLRRPVELYVREGSGPEQLVGRTEHGEITSNPEAANLRGRVARLFDQSGIITSQRYDFKGNLLQTLRAVTREYKTTIDWNAAVGLEPETFTNRTTFDALNRPTATVTPDASVYRIGFNEAGLAETIDVNLRGAQAATSFVTGIDYDADARRTQIVFANGTSTVYAYDPLTLRLARLKTLRAADGATLQEMTYTYDPVGNLTGIDDQAQQTVFYNNQVVTPATDFTHDAVYRLVAATGREHIGQLSQPQTTWDDFGRVHLPHPGDGQAMRRYAEQYKYDGVGNLTRLVHQAVNGNWTRTYQYDESSPLDGTERNNRLSHTGVGGGPVESYTYDAHGNTTAMPHLPLMTWNFRDQLQSTARQVVNGPSPETTFYVYNAGGERVRKITENANGARLDERLYVGSLEIFRRFGAGGTVSLERESLHVMDVNARVALVESRTQGNDDSPAQVIRYQLATHLSSCSIETDVGARVISYEEYFPFGSTSYQAGPAAVDAPSKRYRFTAMERDEESGLAYHSARYYAPWLARWSSSDPQFLKDGVNTYAYAQNRPASLSDPTGTDSKVFEIGVCRKDDPPPVVPLAARVVDPGPYYNPDRPAPPTMSQGPGIPAGTPKFYIEPSIADQYEANVASVQNINLLNVVFVVALEATGHDSRPFIAETSPLTNAALAVGGTYQAAGNQPVLTPSRPAVTTTLKSLAAPAAPTPNGGATGTTAVVPTATTTTSTTTGGSPKPPTAAPPPRPPTPPPVNTGGGGAGTGSGGGAGTGGPGGGTGGGPGGGGPGGTGQPKSLNAAELRARNAAIADLRVSHSVSSAGTTFHDTMGAAPRGIDLPLYRGAFQVELKTHYTRFLTPPQISSASSQSFGYSQRYQLRTGLVPIRQVRHYMLNPMVHGVGYRVDSH